MRDLLVSVVLVVVVPETTGNSVTVLTTVTVLA
jgi:hypothetical protein